MLAEFTIYPTDETHLSRDMARMIEIMEDAELDCGCRRTSLGTCAPASQTETRGEVLDF